MAVLAHTTLGTPSGPTQQTSDAKGRVATPSLGVNVPTKTTTGEDYDGLSKRLQGFLV